MSLMLPYRVIRTYEYWVCNSRLDNEHRSIEFLDYPQHSCLHTTKERHTTCTIQVYATHMYTHAHIHVCATGVHIYALTIHIHMYTHTHFCTCVCKCWHVYICVQYICVYMCLYICAYMYVCTHNVHFILLSCMWQAYDKHVYSLTDIEMCSPS